MNAYIAQNPAPPTPPPSQGWSFLEFLLYGLLVGGGSTGAFQLLKQVLAHFTKDKAPKIQQRIHQISEIYDTLGEFKQKINADRMMIIKVTNGGHIPSVTNGNLYATMIYEITENDSEPLKKFWERRQCDRFYISTISRVFNEKKIRVEPYINFPEGSDLRSIYEHYGIAVSRVFALGYNPKEFYYIVACYNKLENEEISWDDVIARNYLTIIKKLFENEIEIL